MARRVLSFCVGLILLNGTMSWGEMLSVKAILAPKELIYADLPTAQKHVIYFVRREGKAEGRRSPYLLGATSQCSHERVQVGPASDTLHTKKTEATLWPDDSPGYVPLRTTNM